MHAPKDATGAIAEGTVKDGVRTIEMAVTEVSPMRRLRLTAAALLAACASAAAHAEGPEATPLDGDPLLARPCSPRARR